MKRLYPTAMSDSGFTLLEMLVAMTLLGLLSVALFGALRFGLRIWERSETLTAQSNLVRKVQAQLTREIMQAYPEVVGSDPTHQSVAFDGRSNTLSYLAADLAHPGALDKVEIGIAPGSHALTRTEKMELSSGGSARSMTLLGGISAMDISYFGSQGENDAPRWQSEWQNRMSLPSLVRIRARFAEKNSAPWPDLIVVPRISADISCRFDPIAQKCGGR